MSFFMNIYLLHNSKTVDAEKHKLSSLPIEEIYSFDKI